MRAPLRTGTRQQICWRRLISQSGRVARTLADDIDRFIGQSGGRLAAPSSAQQTGQSIEGHCRPAKGGGRLVLDVFQLFALGASEPAGKHDGGGGAVRATSANCTQPERSGAKMRQWRHSLAKLEWKQMGTLFPLRARADTRSQPAIIRFDFIANSCEPAFSAAFNCWFASPWELNLVAPMASQTERLDATAAHANERLRFVCTRAIRRARLASERADREQPARLVPEPAPRFVRSREPDKRISRCGRASERAPLMPASRCDQRRADRTARRLDRNQ